MSSRSTKTRFRCILKYTENDGTSLYWKLGRLDINCYKIDNILEEVETYNKQIEAISNGTAPPGCYTDQQDRKDFFFAKHPKYDVRIGSRGAYEDIGISFSVYLVSDAEVDEYESISKKELRRLELSSESVLREILEKPYTDNDTFSIGYCVLPMTEELSSKK